LKFFFAKAAKPTHLLRKRLSRQSSCGRRLARKVVSADQWKEEGHSRQESENKGQKGAGGQTNNLPVNRIAVDEDGVSLLLRLFTQTLQKHHHARRLLVMQACVVADYDVVK